jgi:serine/threonine protein kinase
MDRSENFTGDALGPQITRDYRIIRLLGKGGMGDVYLAEQLRVGRRLVALKVLNRSCCDNPDLMRRFENEAASAGRIHHRNVVTVYECRVTDDGQPYVAMEYVAGSDLGHEIEQRGRLPLDEVVEITKQIAAGLGAAHKLGIVHRDVKPGNIMLTRDDEGALVVKVLDFGIARLSEPGASGGQTKTGVVMGTPDYMSPEQSLGQTGDKIDSRSDIYSLAMVVNKMLTGRVAFEADSWVQVMYKNINEAPPPPSQMRPELAHIGLIDDVVLKGLEKDREKRQQSATEFAIELQAAYARLKPGSPREANTMLYQGSGHDTEIPTTKVQPNENTPYPSAAVTNPIHSTSAETVAMEGTAAPSTFNDNVTVADKDVASFGTVAMADLPNATAASPGARRPVAAAPAGSPKSPATKRIATVVAAVILLGLSAAAFLILRGPGTPSQHLASDPSAQGVPAITPPQAHGSEQGANAVVASPPPPVASKVNKNAAAAINDTKTETPAPNPKREPTPKTDNSRGASAVPPVAAPAEETDTANGACLGVFVTRTAGTPVQGARVTVIDESVEYQGMTGPKGVWRRCGLTPGHKVSVRVFGPGGALIGSKDFSLKAGGNPFRIQVP